ncbi:FHA domain-containing protein [Actinomadura gamaensis]|uniref:FHA domain-containing protein n=1 Tax=Actinomadura gamaensis TaxID=1763541 RepID=A0ABV9U9K1_9ACTN
MAKCSVCAAELAPGDEFCDTCGSRAESAPRLEFTREGGPAGAHRDGGAAGAGGAQGGGGAGGAQREGGAESPHPEAGAVLCPVCGTRKSGRFCEEDGYDFDTGRQAERPAAFGVPLVPSVPPGPPDAGEATCDLPIFAERFGPGGGDPPRARTWTAVVTADRAYFDAVLKLGGPDAGQIAFPPYCPDRLITLAGERVRIGRRSASRRIEPEIDLSVPPEDPGVSRLHAVLLAQPDGSWTLVDPGSANGTTLNDDLEPIPVNVPVPVKDGDRVHVGAWTTITLRSPE